MPVSDQEFEDFAHRLDEDYSNEMSRRSAISRHYYGCFHKIRETGNDDRDSDFSFGKGGNDHKEAQDWLRRKGQSKLAQKVHRLHEMRKKADYDIDDTIEDIDVQNAQGTGSAIRTQFQYVNINPP